MRRRQCVIFLKSGIQKERLLFTFDGCKFLRTARSFYNSFLHLLTHTITRALTAQKLLKQIISEMIQDNVPIPFLFCRNPKIGNYIFHLDPLQVFGKFLSPPLLVNSNIFQGIVPRPKFSKQKYPKCSNIQTPPQAVLKRATNSLVLHF